MKTTVHASPPIAAGNLYSTSLSILDKEAVDLILNDSENLFELWAFETSETPEESSIRRRQPKPKFFFYILFLIYASSSQLNNNTSLQSDFHSQFVRRGRERERGGKKERSSPSFPKTHK